MVNLNFRVMPFIYGQMQQSCTLLVLKRADKTSRKGKLLVNKSVIGQYLFHIPCKMTMYVVQNPNLPHTAISANPAGGTRNEPCCDDIGQTLTTTQLITSQQHILHCIESFIDMSLTNFSEFTHMNKVIKMTH